MPTKKGCVPVSEKLSRRQIEFCIARSRGANRVPQTRLAAELGVSQTGISMHVKHAADFHPCRTRHTDAMKRRALELKQQGLGHCTIARELGTSPTSVRRWCRVAEKESS